jgi:hypothetical protein
MAIKKINVACVHRQNISQYDSGERCDPWTSCFNFHRSENVHFYCIVLATIETCCGSLVVVLSLSNLEYVSSSPARASCVKPKTFKRGSDCSFPKSTAFRSVNHGSFGFDLKNRGLMSQ